MASDKLINSEGVAVNQPVRTVTTMYCPTCDNLPLDTLKSVLIKTGIRFTTISYCAACTTKDTFDNHIKVNYGQEVLNGLNGMVTDADT